MGCPSPQMLTRFALGQCREDEHKKVHLHLAECPSCREDVEDLQETSEALGQAHLLFDRGHAAGCTRLLAALEHQPEPSGRRTAVRAPYWIGGTPMRRRIVLGTAGLLAAAAMLILAFLLAAPGSLLADVAARVREVKTYSCRCTMIAPGESFDKEVMRYYWKAPGSIRMEMYHDDCLIETSIHPAGKPGIKIRPVKKTYRVVPPRNFRPGPWSPGHWLTALANYAGEPDRELGIGEIDGRRARGFQVAASKLALDVFLPGEPVMRIWVDVDSRLPVLFEIDVQKGSERGTVRFDEFRWDVPLSDDLFQVSVPEGFDDRTLPAKTEKEKEEHLVQALGSYAEIAGHYPKVKILSGDLFDDMRAKAGIPRDPAQRTKEQIRSKAYVELLKSPWGWNIGQDILRNNPDAAYYGMTVGPEDKDKVLFRWRLDDGSYRILYGDLRFETVTAEKLRELESASSKAS